MAEDWSRDEVVITVEAYFDMLQAELRGDSFNKTTMRKAILPRLRDRSNGAIEFKNCNISAALLSLGFPSIDGYKPRWNYQRDLLHAVIADVIARRPKLVEEFERSVEKAPKLPAMRDILSIFDDAPPEKEPSYLNANVRDEVQQIGKRNFLELEANNRTVGLAGEELVIQFEKARLISSGRENLAERIEHVALEKGDGAGFDIRSFDVCGKDLFIEVKTTRFRKEAPFFISSNEVSFSKSKAESYALYRVYRLTKGPKLFALHGDVSKHCHLSPTLYRGSF